MKYELMSRCAGMNAYCSMIDDLHYNDKEINDMNECKQIFSMNSMRCIRCSKYAKCSYEHHASQLAGYHNFLNNIKWQVTEIETSRLSPIERTNLTFHVEGYLEPRHVFPDMAFDTIRELIYHHLNGLPTQGSYSHTIKNVIFNDPATIVFWEDGTKTVVKCQDGEEFDPEKGITMAFFKKMHGNKGSYFNEIKKWVEPYCEEEKERSVHVAGMLASLRALVDRMSKPETSDD